jgi:membrane protein YdbS with pleckstrin-like domain
VSALPPLGVQQSLDPRFVPLERTSGLIATAFVALGALVVLLMAGLGAPLPWRLFLALAVAWVVASLGLVWLSWQWPAVAYRHIAYTIETDGLQIRRGVFWRTVIDVPRSRVQHTDVSQGPLERRFGLGALVVYTAGTDHSRVDLGGLAHDTAFAIRDHLLPHVRDDAV